MNSYALFDVATDTKPMKWPEVILQSAFVDEKFATSTRRARFSKVTINHLLDYTSEEPKAPLPRFDYPKQFWKVYRQNLSGEYHHW